MTGRLRAPALCPVPALTRAPLMAVELLVCTTCRLMGQEPVDGIRPGQILAEVLPAVLPEGVMLKPSKYTRKIPFFSLWM